MGEQTEDVTSGQSHGQNSQTLEQGPEPYPLRQPSEDPRWAVRIVWLWASMAIFLLLFLVTLLILGFWYD
ncbi:MAG: hypothetical protein ACYTAO_09495 [Planctomycetota bacterium]